MKILINQDTDVSDISNAIHELYDNYNVDDIRHKLGVFANIVPNAITDTLDIKHMPLGNTLCTLSYGTTMGVNISISHGLISGAMVSYGSNVTIGNNVLIGVATVIHDGVKLSDYCNIGHKAVLGRDVTVGRHSIIADNSIIPPGTVIPDHCTWDNKTNSVMSWKNNTNGYTH